MRLSLLTRDNREGWTLLTVETEPNGALKSEIETNDQRE
jgi:hypothetical protein